MVYNINMFYVYILFSKKDSQLYSGYTSDLRKRINLHKSGKIRSTSHRGELQLIYYEACLNKYDALRREKYMKSGPGKRFIKSRLKNWYRARGPKEVGVKKSKSLL